MEPNRQIDMHPHGPPHPFPDGWYRVALSKDLPAGKLIGRVWLGQKIVVWRDQAGTVCVSGAFCPHMGALLTPEAGGRLENGNLVCPFHGFAYDATGACVSAFQSPPPACRLGVFPVREANGLIFAYWDNAGSPPDWMPPAQDETGFTEILHRRHTVACHPQDTHENVVDMTHFLVVHGYDEAETTQECRVEGRCFTASFRVKGRAGVRGLPAIGYEGFITAHIWGLGIAMLEVRSGLYGGLSRLWFLATPTEENELEVEIVTQFRETELPNDAPTIVRLLPSALRRALFRRIIMYKANAEFCQDTEIWNNKASVERPKLSAAERDVMMYRRYCRQFYPGFPEHDRRNAAAAVLEDGSRATAESGCGT